MLSAFRLGVLTLAALGFAFEIAPPAVAQSASVSITGFDFAPATITVAEGTTVIWVHNDGDAGHNVSLPGVFRSPPMVGGATFSFTFQAAGSYEYGCSLHPSLMVGRVIVGSSEPPPTAIATSTPPAPATATPLAPAPATATIAAALRTVVAAATPTLSAATSTAVAPTPAATTGAASISPTAVATSGSNAVSAPATATPGVPASGVADFVNANDESSNSPWLLLAAGAAVAVLAAAGVAWKLRRNP